MSSTALGRVVDKAGGRAACILSGMVFYKVDSSIQIDCNHREPQVVRMRGWEVVLRTPGGLIAASMVEVVSEVVEWVAYPRFAVASVAFVQEHCRLQQGRCKLVVDL